MLRTVTLFDDVFAIEIHKPQQKHSMGTFTAVAPWFAGTTEETDSFTNNILSPTHLLTVNRCIGKIRGHAGRE
jgi:hypothetical protein